jgi:hypothetical protein
MNIELDLYVVIGGSDIFIQSMRYWILLERQQMDIIHESFR